MKEKRGQLTGGGRESTKFLKHKFGCYNNEKKAAN